MYSTKRKQSVLLFAQCPALEKDLHSSFHSKTPSVLTFVVVEPFTLANQLNANVEDCGSTSTASVTCSPVREASRIFPNL